MTNKGWRVVDLLDDKQPLVGDVKLARQVVEVLSSLDETDLNVRIPKAAKEFAENTLSEWFEVIAEIEKRRGNVPYIISREIYSPEMDGAPEWNQGLNLDEWTDWLNDQEFVEIFHENFNTIGYHEATKSDAPLSGHYNRFFPVKYVLRVILAYSFARIHELIGTGDEMYGVIDRFSLGELRDSALIHAEYAKKFMVSVDKKSGNPRNLGSEITVGFPDSTEKSRERFVAQFVGSKRKNEITGALVEMGLINMPKFISNRLDEIHLTPVGLKFALMRNPIIDDSMKGWRDYIESGRRFSDDEIGLILNHLETNVNGEWRGMELIISGIHAGKNRPKMLDEVMKAGYELTDTQASQLRNGIVSRMEELMLISRVKEGREVKYELTELATERFLG